MKFEKLREVRDAYKEKKELEEKIVELEHMRISPRGAVYGSERVQTSMKGDIQPESIIAIDGLLKTYNMKLQKICKLLTEFEEALDKLTSRERRVMRHYYADGMTLESICHHMEISWATVNRVRGSAIRKLKNAEKTKN